MTQEQIEEFGIKTNMFVLFCARFSVSLASPKLLCLGKVQTDLAFLSFFRIFAAIFRLTPRRRLSRADHPAGGVRPS